MTHSEQNISYGAFLGLKTFDISDVTTKDMKMCFCHYHLHDRWGIQALIACAVEQNISLEFTNYKQFFAKLTANCEKDDFAYINWLCTPD